MSPSFLSKRDDGRTWRLNSLHNLAVRVNNGLILHPSIPKESVKNVADVGTKNGVWLEDFYTERTSSGEFLEDQRFDGFDISSTRFPKLGNGTYKVHDILRPFPEKYHGHYNLVHVSFMSLALKKKQYATAAANLMDLLKPGGFIQWDEIDHADMTATPISKTHDELVALVTQFFLRRDMSVTASQDVQEALKATGYEHVVREERNSYWNSDLAQETGNWAWNSLSRCTVHALIWSGLARDTDSANVISCDLLQKLDEDYKSGTITNFPLRVVLGRKSVCDF